MIAAKTEASAFLPSETTTQCTIQSIRGIRERGSVCRSRFSGSLEECLILGHSRACGRVSSVLLTRRQTFWGDSHPNLPRLQLDSCKPLSVQRSEATRIGL